MGSDDNPPRRRALALLSEGLDGVLAARLLEAQGIEVAPVHFRTGFARGDSSRGLPGPRGNALSPYHAAFQEATGLGPLTVVDVFREYLDEVVLRPKHGYGSAMNPCIDCRAFFIRKADEMRRASGADVIATGEVLGQDRMAQKRASLEIVERESGAAGRLVRPLSALHFRAPSPEHGPGDSPAVQGVPASPLGSIHGRGRAGQRELARSLEIVNAPAPAGGCCLLADAGFARRLRDLLSHRDPVSISPEDVHLLRVGRHFRLAHDRKAIFGRDEGESAVLATAASERLTAQVASGRGSFGIVDGDSSFDRPEALAGLAARYSTHRSEAEVEVLLRRGGEVRRVSVVATADPEHFLV
jgi:hypothetical protein